VLLVAEDHLASEVLMETTARRVNAETKVSKEKMEHLE
jgi:hypothetical protein